MHSEIIQTNSRLNKPLLTYLALLNLNLNNYFRQETKNVHKNLGQDFVVRSQDLKLGNR